MSEPSSAGKQRMDEALDAGLDQRTANALGAAQDLAEMFRELGQRSPEEVIAAHQRVIEEGLEKGDGMARMHGSNAAVFLPEGGQQLQIRRSKAEKIEVVAGDPSWHPKDEPTPPQIKKGTVLATFENVRDLVCHIRGVDPEQVEGPNGSPDLEI